jgi:hypothetical protein
LGLFGQISPLCPVTAYGQILLGQELVVYERLDQAYEVASGQTVLFSQFSIRHRTSEVCKELFGRNGYSFRFVAIGHARILYRLHRGCTLVRRCSICLESTFPPSFQKKNTANNTMVYFDGGGFQTRLSRRHTSVNDVRNWSASQMRRIPASLPGPGACCRTHCCKEQNGVSSVEAGEFRISDPANHGKRMPQTSARV